MYSATTNGLGLKWYEYITGIPNVSDCFPGNSEYLTNVQRTMGEIQTYIQGLLDGFQANGPEVQAFLNDPLVTTLLTWCGARNAISWPEPDRSTVTQLAQQYQAQERQRISAGIPASTTPIGPLIPPTTFGPATALSAPGVSTTQYLASGSGPSTVRVSPGLPGYEETPWWTNVMEQLKQVPIWAWVAGGALLLVPMLTRQRR